MNLRRGDDAKFRVGMVMAIQLLSCVKWTGWVYYRRQRHVIKATT